MIHATLNSERMSLARVREPRRRGIVLISVLITIVLLSLAAFQYSEYMMAEHTAVHSYTRMAQARALCDSGVHFVAAMLSDPDAYANTLNSNPWNNSGVFQDVLVHDDSVDRFRSRFSVLTVVSPDDLQTGSQAYVFGLTDESGKLNLNSLLLWDSTGNTGVQMLLALPNMTDDIANAIMDWLDPDDTPRAGGAENDYYSGLNPPYQCKNGPLDSLEELLLVKGVTPQLLFGNDRNRNGVLDPEEDDGSGQVDLGWQAYLTVFSRARNTDSSGNARFYLNDANLQELISTLSQSLPADLVQFILAARMYGLTQNSQQNGGTGTGTGSTGTGNSTGKSTTNPRGASTGQTGNARGPTGAGRAQTGAGRANARNTQQGLSQADAAAVQAQIQQDLPNYTGRRLQNISSVYALIDASVSVTVKENGASKKVSYPSPLANVDYQKQYLPILLDKTATNKNTDPVARINVNTAPKAVLQTLPGLQDTDIQSILDNRPDLATTQGAPDPIFQTTAWLVTEANISPSTMMSLDRFLTGSTQVYRFQVQGYFDAGGPTARVEAVVDTNNGRPRIVYLRDLTEMGKGFNLQGNK
jgi:type II secretory pathway component PulK